MRRFQISMGYLPNALREYTAKIVSATTGEHSEGDEFEACRFGYCIRWCDGAYESAIIPEEDLETAIRKGKEHLAKKHWKLAYEKYTGIEITDEILKKYTTPMAAKPADVQLEYARYLNLILRCMDQPWYEIVRSAVECHVSIYNIRNLRERTREDGGDVPLFRFKKEQIYVLTETKHDVRDDYLWFMSNDEVPIDEAKEMFGFDKNDPDIYVINRIVQKIEDIEQGELDNAKALEVQVNNKFDEYINLLTKFLCTLLPPNESVGTNPETLAKLITMADGLGQRRFDVVQANTTTVLSAEFRSFDWNTASMKDNGKGLAEFRVKLRDDIFKANREIMANFLAEKKTPPLGRLSAYDRGKPGVSGYSSWRSAKEDANWFRILFGRTPEGNNVLVHGFVPETWTEQNDYYSELFADD